MQSSGSIISKYKFKDESVVDQLNCWVVHYFRRGLEFCQTGRDFPSACPSTHLYQPPFTEEHV